MKRDIYDYSFLHLLKSLNFCCQLHIKGIQWEEIEYIWNLIFNLCSIVHKISQLYSQIKFLLHILDILCVLNKFILHFFSQYYLYPSNIAFALYSSIFLMWIAGLKASVALHTNLLSNILRGPMNFFDITPTGRIIVRFSHDVNTLDDRMINNLKQFINTFFRVGLIL